MEEALPLIDAVTSAKNRGDWELAAQLCREGIAASGDGEFLEWYAYRINLAFCLGEIGMRRGNRGGYPGLPRTSGACSGGGGAR